MNSDHLVLKISLVMFVFIFSVQLDSFLVVYFSYRYNILHF